ncbi:hypothetical protein [Rugosimonospora africana]|uniref:SCP2 domain-containing protein n=1 Tax=Rugosimonospora africana TaxID=556532 RepID=A0A8J3VMP1_9ACTN|nr:hypothetical protein [Rugosimonospora africana]GIH11892.1 hypothetical protein Raf01_00640 [Rugosimonospora africana]
MEFLSEEWMVQRFRLATSARWLPDTDIRIQHVVTEGPRGTVHYYDDVREGILVRSGLGSIDEPDVTITNLWADELAVMRGEADMFDVLMTGRVDVAGDHGRLFILIPTLTSPEVRLLARALVSDDATLLDEAVAPDGALAGPSSV